MNQSSDDLNILSIQFDMVSLNHEFYNFCLDDKYLVRDYLNEKFQPIGDAFVARAKLLYIRQLLSLSQKKSKMSNILKQVEKDLNVQSAQKYRNLQHQYQCQFKLNVYIENEAFKERRLAVKDQASGDVNGPVYQQIIGAIERQKRLQSKICYLQCINQDFRNAFRDIINQQTVQLQETVAAVRKKQKDQKMLWYLQSCMERVIKSQRQVNKKIKQFRQDYEMILQQCNVFHPDSCRKSYYLRVQLLLLGMKRQDLDFTYKTLIIDHAYLDRQIKQLKNQLRCIKKT